MIRQRFVAALIMVLGLCLGAVMGVVATVLLAWLLLPGCGPQHPGETCDAPALAALGLALYFGAPIGAVVGAWGGQRLARRLT